MYWNGDFDMSICSDCDYYEAENGKGHCKIKHPDLSPTQAGAAGVWPIVHGENNACGEYQNTA